MKAKAILIVSLLLGVALYQPKMPATAQAVVGNTKIEDVSKEFSKIDSTEDKLLIYKLFAGSAEYLKNCKSLQATQQFDPILGRVQSSYGWSRDKYTPFTDAVSAYLISVGYNVPKPLEKEEQRKDFAKIFESLAEATKYE